MRNIVTLLAKIASLGIIVAIVYNFVFAGGTKGKETAQNTATTSDTAKMATSPPGTTVDLTEAQVSNFKIETVVTHIFRAEKEAVGNIVYHEKDIAEDGVKDKRIRFLVANVHENDSPLIHVGQPIKAKMMAYPDRTFTGKVAALGVTAYDDGGNPAIDPNTHRIAVRCEVADPKNELYPGMLATVVIEVGEPQESVAVPKNSVVREGDSTMTVWVTTDRRHFEKRTVKVGLQQDGYDQILDGLNSGELVATDNAVFLSNMNNDTPND